jgi:DNA recombination protein RmuC
MSNLIIALLIGLFIGFLLSYLYLKSKQIDKKDYLESQNIINTKNSENAFLIKEAERLENELNLLKVQTEKYIELLSSRQSDIAVLETKIEESNKKIEQFNKVVEENKENIDGLNNTISILKQDKIQLQSKFENTEDNLKKVKCENELLNENNNKKNNSIIDLEREKVELENEKKYLNEKLREQKSQIEEIGNNFKDQFKVLANQILEDKSQKFTDLNRQNIKQILEPLGKNIEDFKKTVAETYDKESKQRFSLEEKVKELAQLNQKVSQEAQNLTQALKGSVKQQGNWGEMILENILQNSGLVKGREYHSQEFIRDNAGNTVKDEDGRKLQPDIIINLPENRQIVIDSKVSLVAYEKYVTSESKELQDTALKEHILSIRTHINQLSSKNYQDYVQSLDFVMMFIPIEPAYLVAMQNDLSLWEDAYRKRIVLISPTNLIAALKLVTELWQREQQNRNAIAIADRGAKLYEKFVSFIDSLDEVGKSIEKSQKSYENAKKQLYEGSGNLIGQVEKLKKLGLSTQKSIPTEYIDKVNIEDDEL